MFEGIDLLLILQDDLVISRQVLNLKPDHLMIIDLLGPQVQKCYSPPKCRHLPFSGLISNRF
jgi:hypothetical protein